MHKRVSKFVACAILLTTAASAQKLATGDLPHFFGTVSYRMNADNWQDRVVTSAGFVRYGVERADSLLKDTWYLRETFAFVPDSQIALSYKPLPAPEFNYKKLPYSDTVLVILHQLQCGEACTSVLTFWRQADDSLEFLCFNPTCFTTSFGGTYFEGASLTERSKSYFIVTTAGFDGDECWGQTLLAKYVPPSGLCVLASYKSGTHDSVMTKLKPALVWKRKNLFIELSWRDIQAHQTSNPRVSRDTTERLPVSLLDRSDCTPTTGAWPK